MRSFFRSCWRICGAFQAAAGFGEDPKVGFRRVLSPFSMSRGKHASQNTCLLVGRFESEPVTATARSLVAAYDIAFIIDSATVG